MRIWSCAIAARKVRTLHRKRGREEIMYSPKKIIRLTTGVLLGTVLFWAAGVLAEGQYPADYKPSKPAEQGQSNVLTRVFAISTYMTDKINAAGGKDSPVCYRNCMTSALNDVLKCTE